MRGYSFIASPLRYGSLTTLLASLGVATAAMLGLGLALERRWVRPKDMPLAFTIGDPALAVGIASGICIIGSRQPRGATGPVVQIAVSVGWLLFGLWQWRAEVTAGIYTRRQALSPTKIWHQLVIYPALGTWTYVAVIGGLENAARNPAAAAGMTACLAVWIGTILHNFRHPRLGHPPYDWAHLRPYPQPWGNASSTLRAAQGTEREPAAL
jgi:hypothetical protein